MNDKPLHKRRHYFINKKFQTDFTLKFLVVIAITAIAALALFLYYSKGTLTAGYSGLEVKLLRTTDFFLPVLLVSTIGIIIISGIIGIIILILLSHRIAGPLFRFEKILGELYKGDLTLRFQLRYNDQFKDLADKINELSETMDGKIGTIKTHTAEISRLISELQTASASNQSLKEVLDQPLDEITKKLLELQDAANYFNTSYSK